MFPECRPKLPKIKYWRNGVLTSGQPARERPFPRTAAAKLFDFGGRMGAMQCENGSLWWKKQIKIPYAALAFSEFQGQVRQVRSFVLFWRQ